MCRPGERLILTVRMLTYWNSQRIAAELLVDRRGDVGLGFTTIAVLAGSRLVTTRGHARGADVALTNMALDDPDTATLGDG